MKEFSNKLITFTFVMVQGSGIVKSQSELKRKLDQLLS